jgi:hypothetical protein
MIKGLDKATRPNTRRVTSCPEVCSQLVTSGQCTFPNSDELELRIGDLH